MVNDAQKTCKRIIQDINARKMLERKYPENFMVLRYEDLASQPVETARTIYQFIQRPLPIKVIQWLEENTKYSGVKGVVASILGLQSGLNTFSINSTETAFRWKVKMDKVTAHKIGMICLPLLRELSYKL